MQASILLCHPFLRFIQYCKKQYETFIYKTSIFINIAVSSKIFCYHLNFYFVESSICDIEKKYFESKQKKLYITFGNLTLNKGKKASLNYIINASFQVASSLSLQISGIIAIYFWKDPFTKYRFLC